MYVAYNALLFFNHTLNHGIKNPEFIRTPIKLPRGGTNHPLLSAEITLYKPERSKVFFNYEIITNVLVSSFRFICIPVLWVYGYYRYSTLPVRGSTIDVRI